MNWYRKLIFPTLARFDAETVHERTLLALGLAQGNPAGRGLLRYLAGRLPSAPISCLGLTFPNRLGLAAGFDKNARAIAGLALLGFGHIEVGTVTPRAQTGNERPRLFRLREDGALINRLGFPNDGASPVADRLERLRRDSPTVIIGVSLGKQKHTPLAQAAADYRAVMAAVYPYADYLAVNISSPNTPGLRRLQGPSFLAELLRELQAGGEALSREFGCPRRPLLLKIAPELSWPELDDILSTALDAGMAGLIATNTTTDRTGLMDARRGEAGGLSGRPLAERSRAVIRYAWQRTEGRWPLIGVGGLRRPDDVRAMIDAGASLVQLYTGLVYEGPRLPGRLLRSLAGDEPAGSE